MIITAPTGLYQSVLPHGPADPTSVIYTISDGPPPRDESYYQKLPPGLEYMQRPSKVFSNLVRRAAIGDLVYTSKISSATKAISGSPLYGYGQVLDFTDDVSVSTVPPAGSSLVTKHNNNYIDFSNLDFDDIDQANLAQIAASAQQSILTQIGDLQKQQSTLEADIVGLQGQINEANKVLVGLTTIASTGTNVATYVSKVQSKLNILNTNLTVATNTYNTLPDQINALRDQLTALTDLVK